MQKEMDNLEYTIKHDYEKQLTDMQERIGIRFREKDKEIASIISSSEAKIETFRKFMPDQTSIAYISKFIDLFMIGRCDTDTYAWIAHEIQILIYARSPNHKINQFFDSVSLSSQ